MFFLGDAASFHLLSLAFPADKVLTLPILPSYSHSRSAAQYSRETVKKKPFHYTRKNCLFVLKFYSLISFFFFRFFLFSLFFAFAFFVTVSTSITALYYDCCSHDRYDGYDCCNRLQTSISIVLSAVNCFGYPNCFIFLWPSALFAYIDGIEITSSSQ